MAKRLNVNFYMGGAIFLAYLATWNHELKATFNFSNNNATINLLNSNASLTLSSPIVGFSGTLALRDNSNATISSSTSNDTITFNSGILQTGSVNSSLTAVLNPFNSDTITLNNGNSINANSGLILQPITVANAATATIWGQPKFNSALTLGNSSSIIQLGITTTLNQSISGSGTLSLLDDLTLESNVQMPSNVTLNGLSLKITEGTYASALSIVGGSNSGGSIELLNNTTLNAAWTIGSGTDNITLRSLGATLTLGGSGSLAFNGSNLYVNNLNIEGLTGTNLSVSTGNNINFSRSTLTLANTGNFTLSSGDMRFYGEDSIIITNGSTFTISGATTTLTVDGIILYYEQLNNSGISPFLTASGGSIIKLNGGDIRAIPTAGGSLFINSTPYTLGGNYFLSPSSTLTFNNPTPASARPMTLDGAGQFINFPNSTGNFFVISTNVQATLQNIVLKDFNPADIQLVGGSSTLTFGSGVDIQLSQDITINSGNLAWNFNGSSTIDGFGHILKLTTASAITITGTNTLTLKNLTLFVTNASALQCLTDTATINLENVTFVMEQAGFTLATGSITINGLVTLTGGAINNTNPATTFQLTTKGSLTIGEAATLFVDSNITLKYNINPADDLTYAETKRHLIFTYPSSTLFLNGSTLQSTATGLALDFGTVVIKDHVTLITSTATSAYGELGSQLNINVLAGGILDVQGPIQYNATTWP